MDQPEIHGSSVVSWSEHAVATDVNDEVVLMNLEKNRCYGLGSTGSDIWRKIGNPIRVSELIAQLADDYDGPAGKIEADVLSNLAELHSEGLVQIHNRS